MKKISRSSELLWALGVIFVALGVSICSKANLGVSMIAAPVFVIQEALYTVWDGFSVGVVEYALQGVLLVILCLCVQRFNWRYLLAFVVAIIYGYTLDLFMWILSPISFDAVWLRWVMLIVGDVITAMGVACFFRTYMPLQVYELFVAEVSDRFKLSISKTKLFFDMSLLCGSIVLTLVLFGDVATFDWSSIGHSSFHNIGLGTIITTVINSPLILFTGKLIDAIFSQEPYSPKLYKLLKRG